jgi:hypothetical protein
MNFIFLLPWTTHFQHQNNQNQKSKTSTKTLYSNYDSLQRKEVCVKVTKHLFIYTNPLFTKETSQEPS